MRRTSLMLTLVATLPAAIPANGQRFAAAETAPVTVGVAQVSTANGPTLSVLFTDFSVDLQHDSLGATRIVSFQAATDTAPVMSLAHQLRGFVHKDSASRVVIFATVAGTELTRVFDYGTESAGDVMIPLPSPGPWYPRQRLAGTIVITVERRTPGAVGRVEIDSYDIGPAQRRE